MIFTLVKLKDEIRKRLNNIKFRPHFYEKIKERPYLNEKLVIETLRDFNNYLGFQTQEVFGKERQRVGIKISSKYNFVVIIEIDKEDLNIITAWKTDRKWQKIIQR